MASENENAFCRGRPKSGTASEQRREGILNSAIEIFARDGFRNADLDAIAAGAGCAKGTLFNYFETKAGLFSAAVDLVMSRLLAATTPDSDDPVEAIDRGVRHFFTFFEANPAYVELLIQERAEFRDRQKPSYLALRENHGERWESRIEQATAKGIFRDVPARRAVDVIGDLLYGTLFTNHFRDNPKTLEQQATDVLDMILHALQTREEIDR